MKKVLCSALAVIMLLCLTACGSKLAGRYDFYSMDMDGMQITAESLEAMGGAIEMYIELDKDGTGVMSSGGEVAAMEWADGEIWPAEDPTDRVPFTVEGDLLTIQYEDMIMVFKK